MSITSLFHTKNLLGAVLLLAPAIALSQASVGRETQFLNDVRRAMAIMDNRMMVKPVGDPDHDFVAMMVPHHQGAVDMAIAELRYGHDEHLKRIAQEIIVDQPQEIAAMRLALRQPLPPSTAAPTNPQPRGNSVGIKGH